MNMIERIARGLYNANEFKKGWDDPHINKAWHSIYRKQAEAALIALLDMTPEMQAVGRDKMTEWLPKGRLSKEPNTQWHPSNDVFVAMIEAARNGH